MNAQKYQQVSYECENSGCLNHLLWKKTKSLRSSSLIISQYFVGPETYSLSYYKYPTLRALIYARFIGGVRGAGWWWWTGTWRRACCRWRTGPTGCCLTKLNFKTWRENSNRWEYHVKTVHSLTKILTPSIPLPPSQHRYRNPDRSTYRTGWPGIVFLTRNPAFRSKPSIFERYALLGDNTGARYEQVWEPNLGRDLVRYETAIPRTACSSKVDSLGIPNAVAAFSTPLREKPTGTRC